MPLIWTDVTSYRQGQTDRTPTAWAIKIGGIRVAITSGHINNPDQWSVHCAPWFDTKDLDLPAQVPAEEAQAEALRLVRHKLTKSLEILNGE